MHHEVMTAGKLASLLLFAGLSASAQHLSVGIIGGIPLTNGFSDFTAHGVDTITHTFSDSKQYLVGPMVDVRLPLSLGLEVDALYRPLSLVNNSTVLPAISLLTGNTPGTWEFPILAKYRLPLIPIVKPFVEAGPSFRTKDSSISWISGRGFTFGGGIELHLLRLRIAPQLRYTHWGSDGQSLSSIATGTATAVSTLAPPSQQNQAEFLVGFSF
jgi:hypothetical protein